MIGASDSGRSSDVRDHHSQWAMAHRVDGAVFNTTYGVDAYESGFKPEECGDMQVPDTWCNHFDKISGAKTFDQCIKEVVASGQLFMAYEHDGEGSCRTCNDPTHDIQYSKNYHVYSADKCQFGKDSYYL